MIKISFIKSELERIKDEGALDDEQYKMLCLLNKTNLNDKGRALELGMSEKTYYLKKKKLIDRILKVLSKW